MTSRDETTTWRGSALRRLPVFLGFPLGGLLAKFAAGPVDSVDVALVAGAVAGSVLGAVQAWGMGSNGPSAGRWSRQRRRA